MKKFLYGISALAVSALVPLQAFAVETDFSTNKEGLGGVGSLFTSFLDWAVPVLIACAVVYFLYGVLMYVIMGDDEEKKEKAKSTILYGIVGIFVMVSVYGLVALLKNTFRLDTTTITPPTLPDTR